MATSDAAIQAVLDEPLGSLAPPRDKFNGDIVAVDIQNPLPEWGEDAPRRIIIGFRDWEATLAEAERGGQKARTHFTRMPIRPDSRRTAYWRFMSSIEKIYNMKIATRSQLLGLTGLWVIEDYGRSKDAPVLVKPAEYPMPEGLLPYVPKSNGKESEEEARTSAESVPVESVQAFLALLQPGKSYSGLKLRQLVLGSKSFRDEHPAAFALTMSGRLLADLIEAGAITQDDEGSIHLV